MLSYDSALPAVSRASAASSRSPLNPPTMSTPRTAMPAASTTTTTATVPKPLANGAVSSPTAAEINGHLQSGHQIWLVTGPAGSGKSTVAKHLASTLNFSYIEGDEFHPKANIEKMSAGIPLTDADRWDWLTALREESIRRIDAGNSGVVLTCSALKRKYRDVIRVAPYFNNGVHLHFIYLHASEEVLLKRVAARQNHYMSAGMVHSQFDILEPPKADETDVMAIDVSKTMDEVKREALDKVLQTIEEESGDLHNTVTGAAR